MREIILNERAAAIDAIENNNMGKKPTETLFMLAKYYKSIGYAESDISKSLSDFMVRCDPDICLGNWSEVIKTASASGGKYHLVDIGYVTVTAGEMEKIKSLKGAQLQRLMFTLLCLCKYGNAINPKNNNWVNRPHSEIFSLANITLTKPRQAALISTLKNAGFVEFSRIVDNVNIRVCITDPESPSVIDVSDFRNIGNQYRKFCGEPYMTCSMCGLTVKRMSNSAKYCSGCAADTYRSGKSKGRKGISS